MKPLFLITNDDGVFSPGLKAAAEAVRHLGDLLIVAPISQQTGMGRSFPRNADVGIIEKVSLNISGFDTTAYGIHGSPAQAVAYGILELADRTPDFCISGINYGENLGLSVTCSGTLGAAFEADSHGIPSIAVSRQADLLVQHSESFESLDWEGCKTITRRIAEKVLKEGFPKQARILNVNLPAKISENTEIRLTRQSRQNYSVFTKPGPRDFTQGYVLSSHMDVDIETTEKDSDIYAVYFDRIVSLTPLTWDLSVPIDWDFK
ncbi:MAG: 5'/3'-nucleotidase SurE [Erysipelotrichaceae bacterium]